jgi:hypothetical protein
MTIAEYFSSLPRGSIKGVAAKLGYSVDHLYTVVIGKSKPSFFMANALVKFSNGKIDINTINIGERTKHHANKN